MTRRFCIVPAGGTAGYARSNPAKLPRRSHHARSCATSMSDTLRDVARSFVGSEGFEQSRRERKKIEMRFAHLKRILRLDRLSTARPTRGSR